MSNDTELKNRHGDNVSWFCLEGAVSLPELQDDKFTLPSDFEVMGENENGEEGCCQIDVVELLESAHVVIREKDSENELLNAKLLVSQQLVNELTELLGVATQGYSAEEIYHHYGIDGDRAERIVELINNKGGE